MALAKAGGKSMLEADLSEILTPELLEAFGKMWTVSKDGAEVEARWIVETLAEFDGKWEPERVRERQPRP
jgi:hypothetical protein